MLKLSSFILLFCTLLCFGVDRNNFKTCSQSNFCTRQREYQSGSDQCSVLSESVTMVGSKIYGNINCKKDDVIYLMELHKLQGQLYRLKISVKDSLRVRFEPKVDDSLLKEPIDGEMRATVDKEQGIVTINGIEGNKGILSMNPFKLDVYFGDEIVLSVNSRDLIKLEAGTGNDTEKEEFKGHTDSQPYGHSSVGIDISFPGFKHVYGIPEHADRFALRNTAGMDPYRLYNLDVFEYELNNPMALYGSVPLLWAHGVSSTVGVFWHNPTETWVDIDARDGGLDWRMGGNAQVTVDTHWWSETGVIDVFLIMGSTPPAVMSLYGQLTGTTPLPPLFALGYHQCRWNYNDDHDVAMVDSEMDAHDLPYDVIWLDIEHTDDKKYFTWDKTRFPDPGTMLDGLEMKSRKLVTVVDPHIKRVTGWDIYEDGLSQDVFVKRADGSTVYEGWCWPGSSVWPDFNDARVRQWWASKFLTYEASRANNTFSWNDMGEPSVFNGPEVSMEKDAIHFGNLEHRDIHNLYGLQVHRASWEGQLLRSNNLERPFVLTRAFFAGSQRYGAIWTGDNTADWGHLKATTPMLLSLSVTGITFCGADVGGFFGNPDYELLTRWYQAGAFHPFFRAHAHLDTKRREPYLLPEENMKIVRTYLHERYKLLPYWYTLFYQTESTNAPVLSPMWFHFPKDSTNFPIDDQFMVGPAILVKPITDPGVTSVDVYLPPDKWYLHSAWKLYDGAQTINLPATLSTIPVFYRAGFIVPRRERVRRSSVLTRFDPFTFLVFLGNEQNATGQLYIDDYHSYEYKTVKSYEYYSLLFANNQLSMTAHTTTSVTHRQLKLERIVICGLESKPDRVVVRDTIGNTRELEFFFMSERSLLIVRNPGLVIGENWRVEFGGDGRMKKSDEL